MPIRARSTLMTGQGDDGSGIGRLVVIGTSLRERLLYVVHVEHGERARIISARPATGGEREVYATGEHT